MQKISGFWAVKLLPCAKSMKKEPERDLKYMVKTCLFTRILTAPGMWFQNFTTKEPDDSMIEVGIASLQAVVPEEIPVAEVIHRRQAVAEVLPDSRLQAMHVSL